MAENKHLSLQELLKDQEFKEIGEYEDSANADELTNQVAKEWAKTNESHKTKKHGNNYVWYKFKFLDQKPGSQHLIPQGYSNFETKTKLAHWTTDALGEFYPKDSFPKLNELNHGERSRRSFQFRGQQRCCKAVIFVDEIQSTLFADVNEQ